MSLEQIFEWFVWGFFMSMGWVLGTWLMGWITGLVHRR